MALLIRTLDAACASARFAQMNENAKIAQT